MRKKIVCYIHKHTKKAVRVSTTRVSRYSPGSISLFVVTIEFTNASKYTYTHYLHYKSFLDMKIAPVRTNTRSRTVIIAFKGEKLSYQQRSAKTRPLPTAPWQIGQPANRRNKSNLERFDHRIHVPIVWCIKKGKIGFPLFDLSVDPLGHVGQQ